MLNGKIEFGIRKHFGHFVADSAGKIPRKQTDHDRRNHIKSKIIQAASNVNQIIFEHRLSLKRLKEKFRILF